MGACVLCEQQITNPLSPERLAEQMKAWLQDSNPQLLDSFEDKSREIMTDLEGHEDFCIVTGKGMSVCAYCFTEHVFRWLLSLKPSQEMVEQYLTYFNFDVSRKGYIDHAIKLGYAY